MTEKDKLYYDAMLSLQCDTCKYRWCQLEDYLDATNPDCECPVWHCNGTLVVHGVEVWVSKTQAPTWTPK